MKVTSNCRRRECALPTPSWCASSKWWTRAQDMHKVILRRPGAGDWMSWGDVLLSALPASPCGGESVVSWISGSVRFSMLCAIVISSVRRLGRAFALHCKDDTSKGPFSRCEICKNLGYRLSVRSQRQETLLTTRSTRSTRSTTRNPTMCAAT